MNGSSAGRQAELVTALAVSALLTLACCSAGWAAQAGAPTLVVLSCDDQASMDEVIELIAAEGGLARHVFPTHVLIAELPEGAAAVIAESPCVETVTRGYVDPHEVPVEYGRAARDAVAAWNDVYVFSPAPSLEDDNDIMGLPLVGDTLYPPDEGLGAVGRLGAAPAPPGAASWQTSEYMIGNVIVSLVFVESNGAIDAQTENWTPAEESNVVSECLAGANWWISQYPYSVSPLSFTWVYNYGRQTGYEPINRSSSDDGLWLAEVLTGLGYSCNPSTYFSAARNYANDLRNNNNKDWGYAAFIVDSSVDADGTFTDGYFAYAYIGGPFMIMTYDNDGWGIGNMDKVFAHESGHIFRAGDEYCQAGYACCSSTAYYGYLRIQNTNCNTGVTCMMNTNAWAVCSVTQQQLGWRDGDADTIPDILDVAPSATLTAYSPDPTNDDTPTYTGSASVGLYPNQLNPGYDVTVNRIAGVEYRVDGGSWQACSASDGTFDSGTESFTFTTAPLSGGSHTFEVRATDTAGNVTQPPYSSDTLTINAHTVTVTAGANPTTVGSGGTSALSASFTDSSGHGVATWSWSDNGGGGSFSPSSSVQNPSYTAPANLTDADVIIMLTVTATCNGPSPLADSDSVNLTVQPIAHTFQVTANAPSPTTVASGGTSSLSASFSDSRPGHSVATWAWGDGGAGGSFSPSASVQNPSYTAPANTSDANAIVTLTVNATCSGPSSLGDSDSTTLTVQPVPHSFSVTAGTPSPSTVASGGSSSLSATASDSRSHTVSWSWNDGGAGGSFSPSATAQNPTYTAPLNLTPSNLIVYLTVTGSCSGSSPLQDSDTVQLTVLPGIGNTTIGLYSASTSTFYLRNSNSPGIADLSFRYGPSASGWSPVAGDYDADGDDTIGLYNASTSTFYLRNSNSAGAADVSFRYGPAPSAWLPIIGDWDADGDDTVGLYDPASGKFFLRNSNSAGVADVSFRYGPAPSTWLPLAGDWDGDGDDTVGLYNPATGTFYLRNANSAGAADVTFRYGPAPSTWLPIVGDWDADGDDTVGLYDPATGNFFLRNSNSGGIADVSFRYGPAPSTWTPLTGDWDGL